jgi:hypothetical protein
MTYANLPAAMNAPAGKSVTAVAATDIFTSAAHGFVLGDSVVFSTLTGGAGITPGTVYYVIATNLAANTFSVSATPGGTILDVTTDLTVGTVTQVFNWANTRRWFTTEQLGYLAKYYSTTNPGVALNDGTVIDGNVARAFYQTGFLPA